METREIVISANSADELRRLLVSEFPSGDALFETRSAPRQLRGPASIDTSTLVAIIGLGSAAISALITGLFRVLEKRQERVGKIVLKGANGASVEIPADTPRHELKELVALAAGLDQPRIQIE